MAGRFPDEWLDELRRRADLLSIVSEFVALRQNGRKYVGLCPFHHEKTASFQIDPELGLYHCFGCKAGGTVIHFVMAMERLEFHEAVRYLAEKVRMPLPSAMEDESRESRPVREGIHEVNRKAAHFFHETLYTAAGARALSYLHQRGLDDSVIRVFGIGAAPDDWDALTRKFMSDGESAELLVKAGLTVEKKDKRFDMFRNRVIFPIISANGAVLGFGGRAMGDGAPKYLNTADTPAFNKRLNVYAANLLRKERKLPSVFLVEGYMDVVSLYKHGVRGAGATLGTALTAEQARLLKRYAPEIRIAYDGDSAGQNAALRALSLLDSLDIPVRVLEFPGGMDPDDFIRKNGKEAFEALPPLSGAQYRIRRAADGLNLADEEDRTKYAVACASILKTVRQPVELENLLKRLVIESGYSREVLIQQMGIAPVEKVQRAATQRNPAETWKTPAGGHAETAMSGTERAEKTLLSLMAAGHVPEGVLEAERFNDPNNRRIAAWLLQGKKLAALLDASDDSELNDAIMEVMRCEPLLVGGEVMDVVTGCLETMRREMLESRLAAVLREEPRVDGDERNVLLQEITRLYQEIERLKISKKV